MLDCAAAIGDHRRVPLALLLIVALLAPPSVNVHRRLVPAWETLLAVTERDGTPHGAAYEPVAREAGVRIMLIASLARGRAHRSGRE